MEIYLVRKQITHLDETDTTTAGGAVTKNRSILRFSFIYFVFSFSWENENYRKIIEDSLWARISFRSFFIASSVGKRRKMRKSIFSLQIFFLLSLFSTIKSRSSAPLHMPQAPEKIKWKTKHQTTLLFVVAVALETYFASALAPKKKFLRVTRANLIHAPQTTTFFVVRWSYIDEEWKANKVYQSSFIFQFKRDYKSLFSAWRNKVCICSVFFFILTKFKPK